MIGAFARMIGQRQRVLSVDETYGVKAQTAGGIADHAAPTDAPPERFVAKVSDEGGDVYLSPMVESLRAWLRKTRAGAVAEASMDAPQPTTRRIDPEDA